MDVHIDADVHALFDLNTPTNAESEIGMQSSNSDLVYYGHFQTYVLSGVFAISVALKIR